MEVKRSKGGAVYAQAVLCIVAHTCHWRGVFSPREQVSSPSQDQCFDIMESRLRILPGIKKGGLQLRELYLVIK